MEQIDIKLLNLLQDNFPIESRPFRAIGEKLGISEEEVIKKIGFFKESGYIRRIGGIFNADKLGYTSTLCALGIPEDRVTEAVTVINAYNGVTHNYLRNHSLNIWFTLTASSETKITGILEEIQEKLGTKQILTMPAMKVFKIRTSFEISEES